MNLHIHVNILHFQCLLQQKSFHLFPPVSHSMKDGRLDSVDSVLGVATVVWTCVTIYHLSLSTCMGGPAVGIIAIWEQLTVIPSFCLCKISSSLGTSLLEMTARTGTKSFGSVVAHIVYYYQLVFFLVVWRGLSK